MLYREYFVEPEEAVLQTTEESVGSVKIVVALLLTLTFIFFVCMFCLNGWRAVNGELLEGYFLRVKISLLGMPISFALSCIAWGVETASLTEWINDQLYTIQARARRLNTWVVQRRQYIALFIQRRV